MQVRGRTEAAFVEQDKVEFISLALQAERESDDSYDAGAGGAPSMQVYRVWLLGKPVPPGVAQHRVCRCLLPRPHLTVQPSSPPTKSHATLPGHLQTARLPASAAHNRAAASSLSPTTSLLHMFSPALPPCLPTGYEPSRFCCFNPVELSAFYPFSDTNFHDFEAKSPYCPTSGCATVQPSDLEIITEWLQATEAVTVDSLSSIRPSARCWPSLFPTLHPIPSFHHSICKPAGCRLPRTTQAGMTWPR